MAKKKRKKRTILRTTPDLTTMGGRIRALREALGYSQSDLAKRVGTADRTAVEHWETGRTKNIKNLFMIRLCHVLRTTPEYLVLGKTPAAAAKERAAF